MSRSQGKQKGIGNCVLVIALIVGASATLAVSGVQAQNPSSSQMSNMPYDLHFIDMMVLHHRQSIAMGRMAERKGSTPALRAFSKKTSDEQEKELLELKKHRDHWYAGAPEMDHSQMMAQMHQMPSMSGHAKMDMQGDIAKLQAAPGRQFDRLFLDMMIPHHQMAIEMSEEAVTKAEHAEIREIARWACSNNKKRLPK